MKIAEIFYSLQGEGMLAGSPFIFVRLAGCNLSCAFCDTNHQERDEIGWGSLIELKKQYGCNRIIWTGGEPLLQLDADTIAHFREAGYFQAIETNGMFPIPRGLDYVSVSPKMQGAGWLPLPALNDRANEIRLCIPEMGWLNRHAPFPRFNAWRWYLSPNTETDEFPGIMEECIAFCLANPAWSLSIQQHKTTWKIQ